MFLNYIRSKCASEETAVVASVACWCLHIVEAATVYFMLSRFYQHVFMYSCTVVVDLMTNNLWMCCCCCLYTGTPIPMSCCLFSVPYIT